MFTHEELKSLQDTLYCAANIIISEGYQQGYENDVAKNCFSFAQKIPGLIEEKKCQENELESIGGGLTRCMECGVVYKK